MNRRFFCLVILLLAAGPVQAYQAAVVSANPAASKIGLEVLKKGGSAADAAIATAFALAVAEPYNSGLGGGGFLLYYDAKKGDFTFLDYREAAPAQLNAALYAAKPEAIRAGIHSAGVPGFVAGMEAIHQRWRRVSWPSLIEPSIELARKGVPLKGRLKEKIQDLTPLLEKDPASAAIFVEPLKNGEGKLVQSDLAETLDDIRTGGADTFYKGELAQKLGGYFKESGAQITRQDLKAYRVYSRTPYRFAYKGFEVVSSPLPSSGGAGLDLMFKRTVINQVSDEMPYSPRAHQLIFEGMRDYMEYRASALGDTAANILGHTTHLCVIDAEGNIASMTNTLNSNFGSGLVAKGTGILLNNEMDDFSLAPGSANRLRAGRRPLSSMAPTIVFKKNQPVLVIGTPGGVTIPQNLYQTLLFHWNWKAPLSKAIAQPKFYYSPFNDEVLAEEGVSKKVLRAVSGRLKTQTEPAIGNVQALVIQNTKKTIPISDPRGEGRGYAAH